MNETLHLSIFFFSCSNMCRYTYCLRDLIHVCTILHISLGTCYTTNNSPRSSLFINYLFCDTIVSNHYSNSLVVMYKKFFSYNIIVIEFYK